ncbi:MAG: HK97 gp10 family phage protein, partial [Oscillospiraceae bacterium]|nr:HK97 gp10 family phage protein [Oscillospiraceae bacterium]
MDNSKEIVNRIHQAIRDDIPKAIEGGLLKGCLLIEREAKMRVPVKTGNLRNSITHKVEQDTLTGYVGTN